MHSLDAPDDAWWYMSPQEKRGPVGTERLLRMHATGELTDDTLVWRLDRTPLSASWLPLRMALELHSRRG